MKVPIACEESQTVCAAMRERSHEACSADIQEPSGGHLEWHVLDFLKYATYRSSEWLKLWFGDDICYEIYATGAPCKMVSFEDTYALECRCCARLG